MSEWRMPEKCANCPFAESGDGLRLRKALAKGRWQSIIAGLMRGEYFMCHKTTTETGNGTKLLCAGAIEFQEENGCTSNYQRVCENLEYFAKRRAANQP